VFVLLELRPVFLVRLSSSLRSRVVGDAGGGGVVEGVVGDVVLGGVVDGVVVVGVVGGVVIFGGCGFGAFGVIGLGVTTGWGGFGVVAGWGGFACCAKTICPKKISISIIICGICIICAMCCGIVE
jgi:hypothetical protein